MRPDQVSVVIPTYRALGFLKVTLAHLEKQEPDPTAFEVIVVDDGSADGTAEWLGGYGGSLDLKLVALPENRGRSAARNAGIAVASRELLLLLDGDVVSPAGLVIGHAARHSGVALVVIGSVRYDPHDGRQGYTRYLESRGAMRQVDGGEVPARYFLSGHASFPKSLIQSSGLFDEGIRYGEDIDFGIRLAEAGARIIFAPELVVTHLHTRPLKEVIAVAESFGEAGLPMLVNRHPQLRRELRLDRVESALIAGLCLRLLFAAPVFGAVKALTGLLNGWWAPSAAYSYLLYRSYSLRYLRATRQQEKV